MKTIFSKLLPMTLVLGLVFSLCSVLVPIESFASDFAPCPIVSSYNTRNDIVNNGFEVASGSFVVSKSSGVYSALFYSGSAVHITFFSVSSVSRRIGVALPNNWFTDLSCSKNTYLSSYGFYTFGDDASLSVSGPFYSTVFNSLNDAALAFYYFLNPTAVPETSTPSPSPSPSPSATPSIFEAFQPFRSFSGTYYHREPLYFPDSVTSNRYEQYSGIVSNHDAMITDIRTNIDYYSDSVVYKFEYDLDYLTVGATYDFSFLYDADQAFGYVSAYSTVNGIKYDVITNQNTLTGTYTVCGCAPYPSSTGQLTPNLWEFNYNLSNQRAINFGQIIAVDSKITLTVIVSVDEFPYLPSGFDWSQFFQDTRPDNVFLYTLGGLAALPFFISGLSFLALGALIGIILKFMR